MKKLVKKSMPKTFSAFRSCKCRQPSCPGRYGSASKAAQKAANSQSARYGSAW